MVFRNLINTSESNFINKWRSLSSRTQAFIISVFLSIVGIALGIITSLEGRKLVLDSFFSNFSTELIGGVVTYLVLDRFLNNKISEEEEERQRQKRKKLLLHRIRNASDSEAGLEIIRECVVDLQHLHCFNSEQLKEEDLCGISLRKMRLANVDFQNLIFDNANFRNSILFGAQLQGASLKNVDFEGALLVGANLKGADLTGSNLVNVKIFASDLSETDYENLSLLDANASINDILLDENTILPNETPWRASEGRLLYRFTNPDHSQFWREDADKNSPAYFTKWVQRVRERGENTN